MRHNLLASVLEVAADNTRFVDRIAIFEIGHIYIKDEEEALPLEMPRLGMVLTGKRAVEHWQHNAPDNYDFFDLKGLVDGLLNNLRVAVRLRIGRTSHLPAPAAPPN